MHNEMQIWKVAANLNKCNVFQMNGKGRFQASFSRALKHTPEKLSREFICP